MMRECGGQELYSVYRNRMKMSSVIMVSATYTSKLDVSWLFGALADLVQTEPLLLSNVFASDSKAPYHKLLSEINFNDIVFFRNDVKSIQQLNDELVPSLRLPYEDETLPLWRAYIIGDDCKELVWVYDHAIADGSSGVLFHKKLLCSLNKESLEAPQGGVFSTSGFTGSKDFPMGIEDMVNMKPPLSFYMTEKLNWLKKTFTFGQESPVWVGEPPTVPMANSTVFLELNSDLVQNLIKYSRQHKFTMTSLMYAALMKAIAALWVEDSSTMNSGNLIFTCPVNARRYIKSGEKNMEDEIGNFVYQYDEIFPLKDRSAGIDSIASKFNQNLKSAMKEDPPTDMRYNKGKLHYIDVKQYLLGSLNTGKRPETGEISNLGAFEFSGKRISIDKLNFTQGVSSMGAYVTMNLVGVKNGTVNGSISIARDDGTRCLELKDEMLRIIRELVV